MADSCVSSGGPVWFSIALEATDKPELPCCTDLADHGLKPLRRQYLGTYADRHCYTVEIHEARWFDVDALPKLSPGISISRRLIDTVAKSLAQGEPL